MRILGPTVKVSRKLGNPLTPKAERYLKRREGRVGGRTRLRLKKDSDFKKQLIEKQRLRAQYNIHERQLRRYFRNASAKVGHTAERLIKLLETRLDAFVYRSGLARTIYAARQYVSHGHIQVNGRKVDIPSFHVKENDLVSVREKSRTIPCFAEALSQAHPPPYIEIDAPKMSARLTYLPLREDVPVQCDLTLVIEYYSRF